MNSPAPVVLTLAGAVASPVLPWWARQPGRAWQGINKGLT